MTPRKNGPVVAKKKTVAEELIEGFTELAVALESDCDIGAQFNCYQMRLDLHPGSYTPELIKETRGLLRASPTIFAGFLGVSPKTVRQWEQGSSIPQPLACRFMDEIRRNPEYYLNRLRESIVPKAEKKAV